MSEKINSSCVCKLSILKHARVEIHTCIEACLRSRFLLHQVQRSLGISCRQSHSRMRSRAHDVMIVKDVCLGYLLQPGKQIYPMITSTLVNLSHKTNCDSTMPYNMHGLANKSGLSRSSRTSCGRCFHARSHLDTRLFALVINNDLSHFIGRHLLPCATTNDTPSDHITKIGSISQVLY